MRRTDLTLGSSHSPETLYKQLLTVVCKSHTKNWVQYTSPNSWGLCSLSRPPAGGTMKKSISTRSVQSQEHFLFYKMLYIVTMSTSTHNFWSTHFTCKLNVLFRESVVLQQQSLDLEPDLSITRLSHRPTVFRTSWQLKGRLGFIFMLRNHMLTGGLGLRRVGDEADIQSSTFWNHNPPPRPATSYWGSWHSGHRLAITILNTIVFINPYRQLTNHCQFWPTQCLHCRNVFFTSQSFCSQQMSSFWGQRQSRHAFQGWLSCLGFT